MALYSKLIWQLQPKTIIEIGSAEGGSALWFADQLRAFGIDGHVYSIDIKPPEHTHFSNRTFLFGNAEHLEIVDLAWDRLPRPWLISEDSSHLAKASIAVMEFFAPMLKIGEYMVIEDGNVTDIGNAHRRGGGPLVAIHNFLRGHREFQIDRSLCDWYGYNVTACVDGFLKKVV